MPAIISDAKMQCSAISFPLKLFKSYKCYVWASTDFSGWHLPVQGTGMWSFLDRAENSSRPNVRVGVCQEEEPGGVGLPLGSSPR